MSLTQKVKAEARRLGFQLVGVTSPDPPPHFDVYERWLAAGRHGEMGYLITERARQRRANPHQILPECRAILVLGAPYPAPTSARQEDGAAPSANGQDHSRREPAETAGRLACYAWGDDYHHVFNERLKSLVAFIEGKVGHEVPNRWYTDTGPILERELAQRAGLGWIGKNTCLINPQHGSYFLLAEILLGIHLEPDPPFVPDQCGSCTRCLEACPTQCILPDRTIDASRCISYLTIELKGPIPDELRPQMGEWVFGCDVCQQVCPWNERFASPQGDPAFAPRADVPLVNLVQEMALTPQAFHHKFKGSPVKRPKRRGYLRNVAVALGNAGDAAAVPALSEALLHDSEALIRGHAAWALGRIGGDAVRQALGAAREQEPDPYVQEEILAALARANQMRVH